MAKRPRNTPPGGDLRYDYVPFRRLRRDDQHEVRFRYPHGVSHLPHEEYLYPVKQDGSMAFARRHVPYDRAKELWAMSQVREVLER